jgi:DNA gyrase subunit A
MIVRTRVADVSSVGRNTQGVRLVNLKVADDTKGPDRLVSVEVVSGDDLESFAKEVAATPRPLPAPGAEVGEAERTPDDDDDEVDDDDAGEDPAEDADDEADEENEDE